MRSMFTCLRTFGVRLRAAAQAAVGALARAPGQGLVEYGLVLVLIMVVCVAILTTTGKTVSEVWYDKIIATFPH